MERRFVVPHDQQVFVRPVRANDDPLIRELFDHMSKDDLRLRFFEALKEISPQLMDRLTHFDASRAMAFVAINESDHALGVVRLHGDAEGGNAASRSGEYAIAVRSDLKCRGLGWLLMQFITEYARSVGYDRIHGQVLEGNTVMLKMCRELGFEIRSAGDPGVREVSLTLDGINSGSL